ncbi:hypothetical protein DLREEDagrD3_03590 [Denitratisoma sp. agr-D3]
MDAQENDTLPEDELLDEEDAIRRRLVNRIAIAGVMIVALLGGLAIVDALYVPPAPAPAPQMAALPAEADAAKEETKEEAKATEAEPEKKAESETVKEEDKAPTTVAKAEPAPEKPAPEAVPSLNKGSKPIKPITPPAEAKPATMAGALKSGPAAPLAAAPKNEPAQAVAQRQLRTSPTPTYAHNAPASKPLSQPAQPVAADTSRRYLVQMGVFNNVANAEELRGKLEAAGVPAHIEARVQVGPFGSKEEAEAARVKIAALGLDPGILMATKK